MLLCIYRERCAAHFGSDGIGKNTVFHVYCGKYDVLHVWQPGNCLSQCRK